MNPYAVILGNLGNTRDRFLSSGYKDAVDQATMLRQAASIPGIQAVELVGTWDIDEKTVALVKKRLADVNLSCASIIPDHFSKKQFGKGAFTSAELQVRQAAVAATKEMVDVALELGCDMLNLWPGQDGYDYALATDYLESRAWLTECLGECAAYAKRKGIRLSLEYKPKEPRNFSYLARAADTLLLAQELGPNVGVTIDTGHAFMAGENVGEVIALLSRYGNKLFHIHCNDNHNAWDDDMIVGSVRWVEYFEMLYWLRRTGYNGIISMDQYPYREDGKGAVEASVLFLKKLQASLDRLGMESVDRLIAERDPVATSVWMREHLLA